MVRGIFDRLDGELVARERPPGLHMSDLLTMPDLQSGLLKWMIRHRAAAFSDVAAFLGGDEADTHRVLADLIDRGLILELEIRGALEYRVRLAPKRGRALPENLWQALSAKVRGEGEDRP